MNKQALTEADNRCKFITPALVGVNVETWNLLDSDCSGYDPHGHIYSFPRIAPGAEVRESRARSS